jgi:hypothetical protein
MLNKWGFSMVLQVLERAFWAGEKSVIRGVSKPRKTPEFAGAGGAN